MIPGQDPSALQAWLVAVPSAITAVSTWYINRKTKKTVGKTEAVLSSKSDGHHDEIEDLKKRVVCLEQTITRFDSTVTKIRDCQITLAQKYTESMSQLQSELKGQRQAFERSNPVKTEPEVAEESALVTRLETGTKESESKPTTDDEASKPNFGKVKWEK